jgi:hypothetical protein
MEEGIDPTSPRARRMRENEELMEELNRRMERMLEEIREDDETADADDPIAFLCECSQLDCRERVRLEPSLFDRIHRDPDQFVLVPGHEVPDIERVVDQVGDVLIVRKLV